MEDNAAEDQHTPPDEPKGLLSEIETLIVRMIAGVFKFTFVRLPKAAYGALVWFFPTVVKLIRVVILFAIWVGLTFGPGFAVQFPHTVWPIAEQIPSLKNATEWWSKHEVFCRWSGLTWSVLAICGSVWGAVFIRRRVKQKRASRGERARNVAALGQVADVEPDERDRL